MLLFPIVNVTSGEAKPRSTFIAENAILQLSAPAFSLVDASAARSMQAAFSRELLKRRRRRGALEAASLWLSRECSRLGLEAEIQGGRARAGGSGGGSVPPPLHAGASTALLNVICTAPGRGVSKGYEYMLVSAAVDVSLGRPAVVRPALPREEAPAAAAAPATPLAAFVAAMLIARLGGAVWLAKDAVLLVTLYDGAYHGASAARGAKAADALAPPPLPPPRDEDTRVAAAGLEFFMRAHDYSGNAELRSASLARAWSSGRSLAYVQLLLRRWNADGAAPATAAAAAAVAAEPLPPRYATVAPLRTHHGLLRAALHVRALGGGELDHAAVSLAAPAGRLPELDFATLVIASFDRGFTVLVGDAADGPAASGRLHSNASVAAHGGPSAAGDGIAPGKDEQSNRHSSGDGVADEALRSPLAERLSALEERAAHWSVDAIAAIGAGHSSVVPLLRPLLDGAAAAATLLLSRPVALSSGDAAQYLSRALTAARMTCRLLWGPWAPHAALVSKGINAATVTFGTRGDFLDAPPPPLRTSARCMHLSPCDYRGAGDAPESRRAAAAAPASGADAPAAAAAAAADAASVAAAAHMGAGLERVFRAMSGVEERLHASLRGFLLLSPRLFVGVHEYLPAVGLLHAPLVFQLLAAPPPRGAMVTEALLYAALLVLAGVKLLLLLAAAGASSAAATQSSLLPVHRVPLALAALDALAALLLAPLCRRMLQRVPWCDAPITALDEKAALQRLRAMRDRRRLGVAVAAADGESSAAPAAAVQPPRDGEAPPELTTSAWRGAAAPLTLPTAVYAASLAFAFQQLPLAYTDFPLFLAAALALAAPLFFIAAAPLSHAASLHLRAGTATLLLLLYVALSPLGWQLLWGAQSGVDAIAHIVKLSCGHGSALLPVLLHAQLLLVLVLSALI